LEEWKMHDPVLRNRRMDLIKGRLEELGKIHLYDQWQQFMFTNPRSPDGSHRPLTTKLINEQYRFFWREGVDFAQMLGEVLIQMEQEKTEAKPPANYDLHILVLL